MREQHDQTVDPQWTHHRSIPPTTFCRVVFSNRFRSDPLSHDPPIEPTPAFRLPLNAAAVPTAEMVKYAREPESAAAQHSTLDTREAPAAATAADQRACIPPGRGAVRGQPRLAPVASRLAPVKLICPVLLQFQ